MHESWSPAARRALDRARFLAAHRGAPAVEPADVLRGLLEDEEAQASAATRRWLRSGGLIRLHDPKPAIADAARLSPPPTDFSTIPFASSASTALAHAREVAGALTRHDEVGTMELLVGVVEASDEARRFLEAQDVDVDSLLADYHRSRAPQPVPVDPSDWVHAVDVVERCDLARILDANLNRLREALRILEEHARFVLGDERLTREIKDCRHEIRNAVDSLPDELLLTARDVPRDVGTQISTDGELHRSSLLDVVRANAKRAQEASRTLEEYLKVENADAARAVEQVRYRLYAVERSLFLSARAAQRLRNVRLYWLVDPDDCTASLDWMVAEAAAGGVDAVQLRAKRLSDRELCEIAFDLRRWTAELGVLLIINDRPDVARLVDADGVHLGQDDLPARDARRFVGPDCLVGVSTHCLDQAAAAVDDGADYLGVGPVFPSHTKSFEEFPGLDYVKQASAAVSLPQFAIGGISPSTIEAVLEAGATRVAVSSAISRAEEPRGAARRLRSILDQV